jgi:hypothetical protein
MLKPAGIVSCAIDLQDNFSFTDPRISPWNYLRFSDRAWSLFNSDLQSQNRLRAVDFVRAFERVGFETVHERAHVPEDDSALRELDVDERFLREYTFEELRPTALEFAARRP